MYAVKLIMLALVLGCINGAYAWDEEGGLAENETSNTIYNPFMNATDPENAFEYSYEREIMNMPFYQGSYTSNDAISICTSYTIYKQVWDGSSYTQIDNCNVSIHACVNCEYNSITGQYTLPENINDVMTNGFLVKKYFQNLINSNSEYCNNWNNSDEMDNPDIFYTEIIVDTGEANNYMGYMYTSLNNNAEKELSQDKTDYGFGTGRGADAGSGGIYEGLNLYGTGAGDTSGMGDAFNTMFWMMIPLLFILCIMKLVGKII